MYKETFKKIFLPVLLFALMPLSQIKADGGMIPIDYQYGDIYEPSQTSLIVHDNGKEDLYLKVNYEGETNNFVWIVPTPTYPEAAIAAKDIFTELSALTTTAHWRAQDNAYAGKAPAEGMGTNVIVHSQENIGLYEVTVLSATGVDGLFDWLNNNGYKIKEEVKDILDWYVKKEWYFTAMRIDPDSKIEEFLDEFKKIDSTATEENIAEKLNQFYLEAIKEFDYERVKQALDIVVILVPEMESEVNENFGSEEKFLHFIEKEDLESYTEEDWDEINEELKEIIEDQIRSEHPDSIYKYSNYIEPIKISFKTNTIVYPLKISQISTRVPKDPGESAKTNEILLYVLANEQVKAPEFTTEYAQIVNAVKLEEAEKELYSEDLASLKEIISDNEYFLTKIRRDFAKIEMDDDLYLINGQNPDQTEKIEMETSLLKPLTENYEENQKYVQAKNKVYGSALADRLKGKIVLKVEDDGKAYYINPTTKYSHYLGRPADAFAVMRDQGVGITSINLEKIPVGLDNLTGPDSDGDGLPDLLEDAIGTDKNNKDSDGDGHEDKAELENGYTPNGSGQLNFDNNFAKSQSGKIFLQVEGSGESWYIDPDDNKRYFLGRPADAFSVMRNLGLGISNDDFNKL
ncbi:DUF2330 domain-containing protein [bacterium]|nr:DUF2330 domain-containing protein [bacterium]